MLSVLYATSAQTDDGAGLELPSTETLVAVVLVAVATVVGAWLARRGADPIGRRCWPAPRGSC